MAQKENEFTQDFSHPELKKLEWLPDQRKFLEKLEFSNKDFANSAFNIFNNTNESQGQNNNESMEESKNLLMLPEKEDFQATMW